MNSVWSAQIMVIYLLICTLGEAEETCGKGILSDAAQNGQLINICLPETRK